MVMRIIVNADDLGRSMAVNEATFALMDRGLVTSATIIATGEALDDVAFRVRNYPHCSFGVHLFLDEFYPATDLSAFGELLLPDGRLKEDARNFTFTHEIRKALLNEWKAQVDRVKSLGIPISHFDSHHHVHTIPAMFSALKALQRETGVHKLRISMNQYSDPVPGLLLAKKRAFNWALRHWVPAVTTRWFSNFGMFYDLLQQNRLPSPATIELMVHPAAGTYMKGPMIYEDGEILSLNEDWRERLPWDYRLISYNEL